MPEKATARSSSARLCPCNAASVDRTGDVASADGAAWGAGGESCFSALASLAQQETKWAPGVGATLRDGLFGRVDEDQHAAVESGDVDEAEEGCGVDALE